jgi:hypothetical protein
VTRAISSAPDWAPAELHELTSLIGIPATFRLIELRAGTRVRVPKTVNQGTKLAREIGLASARQLAERWGGDDLKVPLARHWRARVYRARGDSYSTIARRLGVNEGTVHTYLRNAGMTNRPTAQLDLFGGN